jgi:predicted NAD/FAD-binding protein
VIATHADEALALLEDPTPDERRVLGAFSYTTNEATLHTDSRYLPRAPRAHASWNYRLGDDGRPTITYHLNRLQALDAKKDYCVTLNEALPDLAGERTEFAGAYFGNGFHEDGLASGVAAARARAGVVRSALCEGTLMHARFAFGEAAFRTRAVRDGQLLIGRAGSIR